MTPSRWRVFLALLLLALSLPACGGGDDDDDNDDAADDDASDNDDTSDDDDNDDATPGDDVDDGSWDGATVSAVSPFPKEVTVTIDGVDTLPTGALDASTYTLSSEYGAVAVLAAATKKGAVVSLTTAKQKLGVTYTLTVSPAGREPLTADFLAADSAKFWAYDFATGGEYQITADRAAVGVHGIVYVEQGQYVADVAEDLAIFDELVYPIETDLLADAPDTDENGRIVILALDGGPYYGGYFSGVNTLPDDQTMSQWGIHSNEMDMVHINSLYESLMVENVVAHEFQHLLYHGRHGFQNEYWEYHDEGLAEAAVHAVFGVNQQSMDYFYGDPDQEIANGLSLVNWQYANYDNYAQAYLWWIYTAGQLGGIDALGDIFDLSTGNPDEVDTFLQAELGVTMVEAVRDFELAAWLAEDAGLYSFEDMLAPTPGTAPTVPGGVSSLDLEPFSGALFALSASSVAYPGTQGAHIHYYGVDADGNVDADAPFDVDGGVLLAINENNEHNFYPPEHSGPDVSALNLGGGKSGVNVNPAWLDPPPLDPRYPERLAAWRYRTLERIRHEGGR
jgi:hypothetical protein